MKKVVHINIEQKEQVQEPVQEQKEQEQVQEQHENKGWYKSYPKFTIKNTTFQYYIEYYDSKPLLSCIHDGSNIESCGNPWNIVACLGIDDEVRKMAPKKNSSPDIHGKPIITTDFLSKDKFLECIYNNIGSDCWLVYTTDDYREIQKIYFNSFIYTDTPENEESTKEKKEEIMNKERNEQEKRDKLYEDPKQCFDDLEKGHTLYVIMNQFYADYIYKKVPNSDIICLTTIKYNTE